MNDAIRWGIIGPGNIAKEFATGLQSVGDAELVAVSSRTQTGADKFAMQFNSPTCHVGIEAIATDPNVDIIYIASPHPAHHDNTITCLNAGKAVLCEKPVAMNTVNSEEMIRAAKENNVFLMEAMWTHCFPSMIRLRELIADGAIGEVRLVRADFCFRADINPESRLFNKQLGGGALLDVGVYDIALAQMIYGSEPTNISAISNIGETGVDEQTLMTFGYESGAMAQLTCALRTATPAEAHIFGTEGHISIPAPFWQPDSILLHKKGKEQEEVSFNRIGNGYSFEAIEAMKCLRAGKLESDIIPHSYTLAVMRTMDRVRDEINLSYPKEQ